MNARATLCCVVLGLTACFRVDIDGAELKCSTDGACPRGYTCDVDNVCRRPDALLDLAVKDEDVSDLATGDLAFHPPDAGGLDGVSCMSDDQCSTGHCADGVCCFTACSGPCVTCNASADFRGQCLPLAVGSPSVHAGCTKQDVSTCGQTGLCGDEGACQVYAASTVCKIGTCTDDATTPDSNCDGSGHCNQGSTPSVACTNGCGGDLGACASMPTQLYCNPDRDACLPTQPLGAACTANSECTSGFCVDGACCNVSVDACGTCNTCSSMAHPGQCVPLPSGATPTRAACVAGPCTATTCDGAGNCAAAASGTICGSSSCADGKDSNGQYASATLTPSECNGTTCSPATPTSCNGATCDSSSDMCMAKCANDAACAKGYYCIAKSSLCAAVLPNGNSCDHGSQCQSAVCDVNGSGTCVDCVTDADCSPQLPYCDPTAHTCGLCPMSIKGDAFGKCAAGGSETCNPLNQTVDGTACPSVRAPNCYATSGSRNMVGTCGCSSGVVCANGTACGASSLGNACYVAAGFPCLLNGDCVSGLCVNGACTASSTSGPPQQN